MRRAIRVVVVAAAAATLITGVSLTAADAAPGKPHRPTTKQAHTLRSKLRSGKLDHTAGRSKICASHGLRCKAEVLTTDKSSSKPVAQKHGSAVGPRAAASPVGYGAKELQKAYGVKSAKSRKGTIVVVGAGAYPTLESDLGVYRSAYGLPSCPKANGCFKQMNYQGGKPYKADRGKENVEEELAGETALDVDMASAACPKCNIVSMQVPVEDGDPGTKKEIHKAVKHFATGVQTAKKKGADAASISYGYPADKYSDTGKIASKMRQPGMAIVASSGDDGFEKKKAEWPQNLSTVTSAGGTSLYADKSAKRKYRETAWNDAGSSCDPRVRPAAGQPKKVAKYCDGHRAASDLSADSDPYTGVAVYDSYAPASSKPDGFMVIGGTSASSPFLGGLYARSQPGNSVVGPNTIYDASSSAFNDVTIGTNAGVGYCSSKGYPDALCDAGKGWDGPTGVGSPDGLKPFTSSNNT